MKNWNVKTTIIELDQDNIPHLLYSESKGFDDWHTAFNYRVSEIERLITECGYTRLEFNTLTKNNHTNFVDITVA